MRWRDGRGVERTFGVECTPETRRPPCGLFLSPSATGDRFRRGNACFSHHFSSLLFPFSCCLSSEGYIRDLKIRKRNCRFTINYNLLISRRGSNNNSNNKFRSILFVLSRNREHVDVTVSN